MTNDSIVLHASDRTIEIPIHTGYRRNGRIEVAAEFLIPWTGSRDWREVYGPADDPKSIHHVSVAKLIELLETREMRRRHLEPLNALRKLAQMPRVTDPNDHLDDRVKETLEDLSFQVAEVKKKRDSGFAGLSEDQKRDSLSLLQTAQFVQNGLVELDRKLAEQEAALKTYLQGEVEGKVVIMGYTATGAAADVVPTSLHARCPGVVAHGVIYNAIMTGNLWRKAPTWLEWLVTAAFGLLTTFKMAGVMASDSLSGAQQAPPAGRSRARLVLRRILRPHLTPFSATVVGVSMILIWIWIDGSLLFGQRHIVMALTPPLIAVALVWSMGIAAMASERFRITQLLRGYVDPKLMSYLAQNPEEDLFQTKAQEVTVCFTDIKGFTTLTQKLGNRMVPLLQEYLTEMVEVIRRNGGVVNKFMGDGIMFIFGVPQPNTTHPEDAIRCVLEMEEALARFNARKQGEGYPDLKLTMRCGVHTGTAYVGDAGPKNAREYTALGDTTNLAARLETVNKDCGTLILVSQSTKSRVPESRYFFRPIGKIKVRNREGCVAVFELVGRADEINDSVRDQTTLLTTVVGLFQTRQFDQCLKSIEEYERRCGSLPEICKVYRRRSQLILEQGVDGGFEGQVVEQL